jgi:two-component system, chemotaxis family, chemotaxis protein CheY
MYCRYAGPESKICVIVSNGLLIVDDDANIRSVIRAFVEADGYKVCGEAADGVDAIQRAAELQPDLILLDLAMPRLNGAEAASVLRRGMPHVPIVLFTMYADDFGEKLASAVGVDVVLSKPEGMSKLSEHLKVLLDPDEPRDGTRSPKSVD